MSDKSFQCTGASSHSRDCADQITEEASAQRELLLQPLDLGLRLTRQNSAVRERVLTIQGCKQGMRKSSPDLAE